jgi:hypothetical protein
MPVSMLALVVDCLDPKSQAEFWARVLGGKSGGGTPMSIK